jgi:hypothetical protein
MKNKLFAAAIVVAIYVLFIVVLTGTEQQGSVTNFLSEVGLSDAAAQAGTELASDSGLIGSFRDPMPPPSRKPAPPAMN